MSTTNTNKKPASRPACFTKSAWETATYDAYKGIVALVEGKTTGAKFLNRHANLFKSCGIPADGIHLLRLVTFMSNYTTYGGDKVLKVKAVSTLRKYFNGEWASLDARRVVYDTKTKDPRTVTPKKSSKSKKVTTEAVTEYIAALSPAEKAALIAAIAA